MSEPLDSRHAPRLREVTYRQVFMGSLVVLSVVYVAFSFWVLFAPTTLPVGTVQRQPVLLVIVPAFATLLAALTATVVTSIWWSCWGWWHPVTKPVEPPRPSPAPSR